MEDKLGRNHLETPDQTLCMQTTTTHVFTGRAQGAKSELHHSDVCQRTTERQFIYISHSDNTIAVTQHTSSLSANPNSRSFFVVYKETKMKNEKA